MSLCRGHASQLPVSGLQTCVTWGPSPCRALGSCRVGLCVRLPWVPRPCVALGLTREGHVWAEPVLSQVYLPFRFFSSSAPPPRLLHIVLTFGG